MYQIRQCGLRLHPARPEAPVFGPNFSLDIRAKQNIALVGGSGYGKSTVAILLARLYNLNKGSNHFYNRIIMDIAPSVLREQIGVASQERSRFCREYRGKYSLRTIGCDG